MYSTKQNLDSTPPWLLPWPIFCKTQVTAVIKLIIGTYKNIKVTKVNTKTSDTKVIKGNRVTRALVDVLHILYV